MKIKILTIAAVIMLCSSLSGQGTYYGVKGGLGLNNQNWDRQFNTSLLFTPLVDFFAETYDPGSLSSLYAQIGYHQRGSGLGGFSLNRFATYRFHNVALELGGKRRALDGKKWNGYYLLALRAEYTVSSNLVEEGSQSIFNLALEQYVRNFNYGATVGGGFAFDVAEGNQVFVEMTFNPDLSAQYDQPFVIGPLPNPFNPQNDIFIDPQKVRNYSLELKFGIKWLR